MNSDNLFKDFSKSSSADWKAQIEKDLKGKAFSQLISTTADGIEVQPFYHKDNTETKPQPTKKQASWNIVQELFVADAKQANKEALDHLNRGANALLFYLYDNTDLGQLLSEIELPYINCHFVVEGNAAAFAKSLNTLIANRGWNPGELHGSVNMDCLESIARTGNWKSNQQNDFEDIKTLGSTLPKGFKNVCINANLFGNAGATLSQQLGIALGMGYEYVHQLEPKDSQGFWFNFAIGSDYFGEISKLRAFRRLWLQMQNELDLPAEEISIYAETALRNKTILDAYNNQIRTTSEAMAAAIGGANEISVKGFNHTYKEPDFFGERIAKNQQNILEHESHLSAVSDISKGTYFIETLTEELAQKGWDFFKAIESQGGYIASLQNGWLQSQVEESANKEQLAFDEKNNVLIGANKHAKTNENLTDLIEYGMFAGKDKETEIQRIVPRRLSEGLEKP